MKTFLNIAAFKLAYENGEIPEILYKDLLETPVDAADTPFMEWLGGNVHVCESEKDIDYIQTVVWSNDNHRYFTPHEVATSWDICDYLGGKKENHWGMMYLANNNAGGPSYYIPSYLWSYSRFSAHVAATNLPPK